MSRFNDLLFSIKENFHNSYNNIKLKFKPISVYDETHGRQIMNLSPNKIVNGFLEVDLVKYYKKHNLYSGITIGFISPPYLHRWMCDNNIVIIFHTPYHQMRYKCSDKTRDNYRFRLNIS